MTSKQNDEVMKWRPHHIYCVPFLAGNFPGRGDEFDRIEDKIKKTLRSYADTVVEVIEGADELCRTCPLCRNNRCQSPNGDEEAVRKWDGVIMKRLGISYGERKTAKEFRSLIEQRAPLDFCRTRCSWKDACAVFG